MLPKTKLTILAALFPAALLAQHPFGVLTSATPPNPATMVQNQGDLAHIAAFAYLSAAERGDHHFHQRGECHFAASDHDAIELHVTANSRQSNTTSTIDQLSSAIGSLYGQIVDIQNKADAAFYATLTSAQQTTLGNTPFGGFGPGAGPIGPPSGN
jgi:hypothetical protein